MVRKVALFALFGFLAVTLAGPLLAMLAVIVSFALIGFLIWLLVYAIFAGNRLGWRKCLAHAGAGLKGAYGLCRTVGHIAMAFACTFGHTLRAAASMFMAATRNLRESLRGTASVLGAVIVETASGAIVGGFLAYFSQRERYLSERAIGVGVLVGALVGIGVVLARRYAAREGVLGQVSEGRD
jgi:hypothetical protein